ncbi:MAG: alpha/beta-hydrolase family protein [Chromatiales bacterium]|nr:alpha/beta-hydrolase family protein [Chromatiales bacterium]
MTDWWRFLRRHPAVLPVIGGFRRFTASLCTAGLLVATLFFAASLTPSLLPRPFLMQGVLSGCSLAAGYGVGVFGRWLWRYLELPVPRPALQRLATLLAAAVLLVTALLFLRQAADWQNSIRALMTLDPVDTAHPFRVGAIAALVAVLLLTLARLFRLVFQQIAGRLRRFIPRRIANVAGLLIALVFFWSLVDGLLIRQALRSFDASFAQFDALLEPDLAPPEDPQRTGSEASLIRWGDLGRTGRAFVSRGPDSAALADYLGDEVHSPIRVYVGLNSAEEPAARARLALAELKRVGAFERPLLVLMTPTGTGWIDPSAADTLEYLHRGNVASVAVQYSYLPSWLSLLAEADHGAETARAVFAEIYRYWTMLPPDLRPRLYLHGLSLGALNSALAADLYDVIADPFHGALWSGPPFRSETWRTFTTLREPGSPAWLPRFRDGSIVRFANQHGGLDLPGASWGPIRIVFLQYASDPITFFERDALFREPEWMAEPRGHDVSPELRWFPVVTMLQLAIDIAAGDKAPMGHGHVYAPEHYIDAWVAVTDPPGWSPAEIGRLKAWFEAQRAP